MSMIYLLSFCTNSNVLTVFMFIKYIFTIICTILPLVIMYQMFSAMFKVVVAGNKINEHLSSIFKSFVAALIVFLFPGLFSFIFTDLVPVDSSVSLCFTNATYEKVKEFRESEKIKREEDAKIYKEQLDEAIKESGEKEKERNEQLKDFREEHFPEKEEPTSGFNNNSGGNSSYNGDVPGSSNTNLKTAAKNIIIGDSRTVGMCATITGNWNNCQYNKYGPFATGDDIYIAQGSMGYSWFNSTAVGAVNSILQANPGTTFNIYSLMGVNFLLSDIDKYIPKYKELAQGAWSHHNLILVSVNPVDEAKEAQNGYSTKQSNIVTFNTKLKNGTSGVSNIKYCDTYSKVINNLSTSDGLHYGSSTYNAIYSAMKSCGG